ncbi:GATA transcription factor 7-like [Cynara cardunculus var. scolymus]|uniref:Zinc finger, GATA-type n=1 Tax=Cynara cardunculus var. scolymus TaxID=59895 RepID=A0A118K520_CYNCS|nr:GATA transcription factor 7-like [Cynara cardunculus var. scolymus]KVI08413.1 Zinc finger, GATA-type [Cynara cardunculus var. scolymus]
MDFCRNVSVSGGIPANYPPEQQLLSPSCSKLGSLDDLFSGHSMEEGDINTEWLSIFVEDCLSSSGSCIPVAMPLNPMSTTSDAQGTTTTAAAAAAAAEEEKDSEMKKKKKKPHLGNNLSLHKLVVPCKARSKRRKRSQFKGTTPLSWCQDYPMNTDPPLLHQAYWLADSELILPNKSTTPNSSRSGDYGQGVYKQIKHEEEEGSSSGQGRRCSHCLSQRTPQWRAGPEGPKTLCNACGVRYKSGRLLPEYRPAKSPTFVSYKHSNSHKKVLEMRMCSSSSS